MPRVRYTADGGHYRVAGYGFDPGDVKDVDDDTAAYLDDVDVFERVDGDGGAADGGGDDTDTDGAGSDAGDDEPADESGDAEVDIEEYLDDNNVDEIADDIHDGQFDGRLDPLDEAADRVGVQDAIGERRAELEG